MGRGGLLPSGIDEVNIQPHDPGRQAYMQCLLGFNSAGNQQHKPSKSNDKLTAPDVLRESITQVPRWYCSLMSLTLYACYQLYNFAFVHARISGAQQHQHFNKDDTERFVGQCLWFLR